MLLRQRAYSRTNGWHQFGNQKATVVDGAFRRIRTAIVEYESRETHLGDIILPLVCSALPRGRTGLVLGHSRCFRSLLFLAIDTHDGHTTPGDYHGSSIRYWPCRRPTPSQDTHAPSDRQSDVWRRSLSGNTPAGRWTGSRMAKGDRCNQGTTY